MPVTKLSRKVDLAKEVDKAQEEVIRDTFEQYLASRKLCNVPNSPFVVDLETGLVYLQGPVLEMLQEYNS